MKGTGMKGMRMANGEGYRRVADLIEDEVDSMILNLTRSEILEELMVMYHGWVVL